MGALKWISSWLFFPLYFLYRVAHNAKDRGRHLEYYAFPILVSMLATFLVIRISTQYIFPNTWFAIKNVHIHHFVWGIIIQQFVVMRLFLKTAEDKPKRVYLLALLYGVGVGLLLDEFDVWLKLDGSPLAHSYTRGVVIGSCVLILFIVGRSTFDVCRSFASRMHKKFKVERAS